MKKTQIVIASLIAFSISGCNTTGGTKSASLIDGHLKTEEIKALFSGKTADWEKPHVKFKTYTDPSGEMQTHYLTGKKTGKTVKIKWSAENDMHCGHRDGKKFCGHIVLKGEGIYHKIRDGKYRATLTNFVEGKTF